MGVKVKCPHTFGYITTCIISNVAFGGHETVISHLWY